MDWTSIGNQLIDILLPILATFLTGLFTYLGTKIKSAYEKKVNTETAKTVVQDVVKFVEQVYTDLHGKEKLQKAIEQTSTILQSKGITLTETEITMLIEAAVFGLNEGISSDDVKKTIGAVLVDGNQTTNVKYGSINFNSDASASKSLIKAEKSVGNSGDLGAQDVSFTFSMEWGSF